MKNSITFRVSLLAALMLTWTLAVSAQINQAWVTRYNNGLVVPTVDTPIKVVVDSATGNSVVAGSSSGDIIVTKYDSSGNGIWTNRYNGPANGTDTATAMVVDASGNIYVTGSSEGSGSSYDYVTIKYDSSGVPQWTNRFNGQLNADDQAKGVVVDSSGNVFVSGASTGTNSYDFATIKYNSSGVAQWTNLYNGPASSSDQASSLILDNLGNVIVVGASAGTNSGLDYATIKYDTTGAGVWTNRYTGSGSRSDIPAAMTTDNQNSIYVTGSSSTSGSGNDFVTVKYLSTGVAAWTNRYNGTGNSSDQATAVAVDISRNVYVTGYSYDSSSSYDIVTIKCNSSGSNQWINRFNGTQNGDDQARAITLDGSGNVYVAGTSDNAGSSYDYTVFKINTFAGTNVWVATYNGPGNGSDIATSLGLDGSGNVYATGASDGAGTGADFATVKFDSNGQQQWVARFNDYINGTDEVVAMAVDSERNVYLGGKSVGLGSGVDFVVIKQNYNGTGVWTNRFNGAGNGDDILSGLAVDTTGNVFVTGQSDGDYVTIKYSITGSAIWTNRYDGPGSGSDVPVGLALDSSGNVFVTGTSMGASGNSDYATVKYSSSGAGVWTNRYNGPGNDIDEAAGIAVDSSGNVYVTGSSLGAASGEDYATLKINGSTGSSIWTNRYDGPVNDYDLATALTVDSSGNVIVTGHSIGSSFYDDYATVKYSSAGVPQWTNRYDGPVSIDDVSRSVAVDTIGNVYVTGSSYGSSPLAFPDQQNPYPVTATLKDIATIKYNSSGVPQWTNRFNALDTDGTVGPAGNLNDEGYTVGVDSSGNVFVAGYSENASSGKDFITIEYNSSGTALSTNYYDGLGQRSDVAASLIIKGKYNVFVSGSSSGASGDSDFATLLYYQTNVANAAPTTSGQTVSTLEDTPLPITLTGSDSNSDPLFYVIITPPANGTLTSLAPNATYTPNPNYFGSDSFTYKVSDGLLESSVVTVNITVTAVNDPPVVGPLNDMQFVGVVAQQTVPFNITQPANENGGQTITVTASSSNPSVVPTPTVTYTSPNSSGTIKFTPVANAAGTALVTVTATDNGGTANGGANTTSSSFVVTVYRSLINSARAGFPVVNSAIFAMLETNHNIYLGGAFTEIGTNSGHGILFNATNGQSSTFPEVDRGVSASVSDGNGGWYIGGDFTTVGGLPRFRLAHILTNGVVDPNFSANVDSTVSALALSSSNLYVGGSFIRVTNGVAISNRFRFAVLNPTNGTVKSLASDPSFDQSITAIAENGTNVYVGGNFTNVTNIVAGPSTVLVQRFRAAAISLTNGQPTAFQADCDRAQVYSLLLSGTNLYMGGDFLYLTNGANFYTNFRLAMLNYTSGVPRSTFRADLNSRSRALLLSGTNLYVGGDFTGVTNVIGQLTQTNRNRLAALNYTNGVTRTWDPNFGASGSGNIVRTLALWGTNLYVGGDFTNITSSNVFRRRIFAVSTPYPTTTNFTVQAFDPGMSDFVSTISAANGTVYVGGGFSFYRGVMRSRLAAVDAISGAIQNWDPGANNTVLTMVSSGTNIVVGGQFTATRSSSANNGWRLAVLDTNTGSIAAGITNGNFDSTVRALAVNNGKLYVGGDFTIITNRSGLIENSRIGLAMIDLGQNGALSSTFIADSFQTGASNVLALAVVTNTLYVGGTFTNIGTFDRFRFAALDPDSGDVKLDFRADMDNSVQVIQPMVGSLVVGGAFLNITNASLTANNRNRLGGLNYTDGSVSGWNPNMNGTVYSLETIGTNLYAGGSFTAIGTSNRNRMGEISFTTASVSGWNPDIDSTVHALVAREGNLFMGGAFTTLGGLGGNGRSRQALATFDTNSVAINVGPTFATISDLTINEDTTLNLDITGISAGPPSESSQTLTMAVTSSNPGLIPTPTFNYTSPNDTASITITPVANLSGSASITIIFSDNGGTVGGGVDSTTNTFTITITGVNDPPTLNALGDLTLNENAATQTINLGGISVGPANENSQSINLPVTAVSSNTALIPTPTVSYTSGSTGTVSFTPVAHGFGTATLSVIVTDNGGTLNGGVNSVTNTFVVTILSSNDPPTMNNISSKTMLEDITTNFTVNAIFAGGAGNTFESGQVISLTASSSNPSLVNPSVTYTSPNTTGTMTLTPVANQSGTATITYILHDDGGTANGGIDSYTNTFTVTVTAVNDPPTLGAIGSITINEDTATTVNLSGITVGPANETGQTMTVSASSSNTGLIPNSFTSVTNNNSTGSITFTPVTNAVGTATISVVVTDNGSTVNGGVNAVTNTFTVVVTGINDPPTLNALSNMTVNEDTGAQTVNLTGLTAGPSDESGQTLTVSATSSDTSLIPNPGTSYTPGATTGSLSFTPVVHSVGTATVSVIVTDTGGTSSGGINAVTNTFTVVVSPNVAPTLNALTNLTIELNAPMQTVNLSGIAAGAGATQSLNVNAFSSDTSVIPNPNSTYTSPNATGSVAFTPVTGAAGTITISVVVADNGGTANGGVNAVTNTFTVMIVPNAQPTLDSISSLTVLEDSSSRTINLTGIGAGGSENQTLTVSATSSDTAVIPAPFRVYTSPNTTADLTFTPVANANGTVTISVTVQDSGGSGGGAVDSITRTFTVAITAINDTPTLGAISSVTVAEDAGLQTVTLSGISAGPANESGQILTVAAASSNTALIPTPTTSYTSGTTGSLSFTPATDASGTANITVTVTDDGGTLNGGVNSVSRTFTVTVTSINDAPTLSTIGSLTINEDSGTQTVNLNGITAGGGESQTLTVSATSSDTSLITNPVSVIYNSPSTTGSLSFSPVANAFGTATISVVVTDTGGTANGGVSAVTNTFTVTVSPVNDAPAFTPLGNQTLGYNSGDNTRTISGISAGPANEGGQTISVNASSSNTGLIPTPSISYTSPNTTASITLAPTANTSGTATITVVVSDDGGTANGGVNATTSTYVVVVNPGNSAPVPDDQTVGTDEETAVSIILSATDPDAGDSLVYALLSVPHHGILATNSSTHYSYAPNRNFAGLDSFQFSVFDGHLYSTGTVSIVVTNTPDLYPFAFSNAYNLTNLPVGAAPASIVSSKFYKNADLAVANYSNNTVSIFLGNGLGGFTNPLTATIPVGNGPIALAAGKMNGDAYIDLVVANHLDNTIQVLLGDGLGGFTPRPAVSVPARPSALALGDFNKDTFMDVAVVSETGNTVTIYTGTGDGMGGLSSNATYAVSQRPMAIATADVNKDMKLDLVVANYDSDTVSVLLGNGFGVFSPKVDRAVGHNPTALLLADFNLDKLPEIITANYGDDTISVLINRTNTFTAATNYPVTVNPSALATLNINKDITGYPDLVIAGHYENSVSVMLGKGSAQFEPFFFADPSASQAVGTNPISLVVGLFNKDADPDVAVANWGSGNVSILLNNYTPLAYDQKKLPVYENTTTLPEESRSTWITLQATYGPLNYVFVTLPTNGTFVETNWAHTNADGTLSLSNLVVNPRLRYQAFSNANGVDIFSYYVREYTTNSSGKLSKVAKVDMLILAVNDPPNFGLASNEIVVLEDAGKRTITNFIVNVDRGANNHVTESKDSLGFTVTNSLSNLFKVQPGIKMGTGTNTLFSFELWPNAFGTATVGVAVWDKGKTVNGGKTNEPSYNKTFTFSVVQSNDTPALKVVTALKPFNEDTNGTLTFTIYDVETPRADLVYTVLNVTNLTLLPDGVSGGEVAAGASTNFVWGWSSVTNRTLTVYPAHDQYGTNVIQVRVSDGTNSVTTNMTVAVASVNDAPSFTPGSDVNVTGTSGAAQVVTGWATGMSAGPANESAQTLTFVVATTAGTSFTVKPAINSVSGDLTFVPKAGVSGILPVTVYLKDNGASLSPNRPYSTTNTFNIIITP